MIETVGWAAGGIGLTLAAAAIVIGRWDHDSGYFLLRGAYISQGIRPYLDYHVIYPPLVDVITAFAVRTQASRLFLALGIPFAWILATSIASGVLTWTITRSHAIATLIAALFPLYALDNGGNHLTLEYGVTFFSLLALAVIAGEGTLTGRRLLMCGIFVAAAGLCKQNGAVALLPVAAILYARRGEVSRKMIGAFVAGLAMPPLAILAWLRFDVVAIYYSVVTMLVDYAAISPPMQHGGWGYEFVYPVSAFLEIIVIVCGIAVMVYVPRWRLLAGAGLAAAVIEALPRILRDYRHYNLNMWAFMVLLLALAAAQPNENRRAAVVAVLLIFATATNFHEISEMTSTESLLFRVFTPVAHVVEWVTPPDGVVRQYGAEPIIEFLASRREDRIDKLLKTPVWDGSGIYDDAPSKETTVVVIDKGQPWVPPLQHDLQSWRFRLVARFGARPQISVYRSLDATKRP
ncbi:MAG TPA: hypothetical protein VF381_12885 [Thermoanaerobaculia bacterium]